MPETHNPQPFRNAGDIAIRAKPWLVRRIIPQGCVTLIVGDVRHGLHEVLYDFAARGSRGAAFPGSIEEFENGVSLVVNLVHAPEDHAIPLLTAAEAGLQKIDVTAAADILAFDKSVESLIENWLIQKGAGAQSVYIDDFDIAARYTNKSTLITALSALAVRYGVAIICGVNQQDVGEGTIKPLERSMHPHQAAIFGVVGDDEHLAFSALTPAQTPDAKEVGFKIVPKKVGFGHRAQRIDWNKTAEAQNSSLQNLNARSYARKLLVPFLKNLNVVTSKDLFAEAHRLGITENNAKWAVKAEGFRKGRRGASNGYGYWFRPGFKDEPIRPLPDDYLMKAGE